MNLRILSQGTLQFIHEFILCQFTWEKGPTEAKREASDVSQSEREGSKEGSKEESKEGHKEGASKEASREASGGASNGEESNRNDGKETLVNETVEPTTKFKTFIQDAYEYYAARCKKDLLPVYTFTADGGWELSKRIPKRSLATMHFHDEIKLDIIREIQDFFQEQDEARELAVPLKRVYLFTGRQSGKSQFINSLLSHFGLNKAKMSIEDIDEGLFCVSSLPNNTAIVMEDIDRSCNSVEDINLTISNLHILDGREGVRGLLIFLTCHDENKLPELVQEALLASGRIDKKVAFGEKSINKMMPQVKEMFCRFLPKQSDRFDAFWKSIENLGVPNMGLLETFFWNQRKSQNICKQIKKLKVMVDRYTLTHKHSLMVT